MGRSTAWNAARRQTMILGLVLRLVCLCVILLCADIGIDPYMIYDDRGYENLAVEYLKIANSVVDVEAFERIGAAGYLEIFYPWLICISAKLFGTIYASRFINCLFSAACVGVIYDLTFLVCKKEKVALNACRLFAYLPVTVLTCCFPIKDIFLTYATMRVLYQIVAWQQRKRQTIRSYIWCLLLLFAISRTRGAIVEYFLIIIMMFFGERLLNERKYKALVVLIACGCVCAVLFGEQFIEAFTTKVDDYAGVVETGNGIKMIQMRNPWEVYKLPFSYFYASLQPMTLNLFQGAYQSMWMNSILVLNISIYPIAISNFLYIFRKKDNILFWVSTALLFTAISALSLGNSRHYLFLIPVEMINASLLWEKADDKSRKLILGASICLMLMIALISR